MKHRDIVTWNDDSMTNLKRDDFQSYATGVWAGLLVVLDVYLSNIEGVKDQIGTDFSIPILLAAAIPFFVFILCKDLVSAWNVQKGSRDEVPFGRRFWRFALAAGLIFVIGAPIATAIA